MGDVRVSARARLLDAAAELPADARGRQAVSRHKEQVESILTETLTGLTDDVAATAEHLAFLLEGSMSLAGLEGGTERLTRARDISSRLLGSL